MGFLDFLKPSNKIGEQARVFTEEEVNVLIEGQISSLKEANYSKDLDKELKKLGIKMGKSMNPQTQFISMAYASVYQRVSRQRIEVMREIEKFKDFWLVDTIVEQLTEDALSPDVATENVLDFTSANKVINKELKWLNDKFDFDKLATSVCPDILLYGEYTLALEVEKDKGVISVNDTVEQGTVISLDKGTEKVGYLTYSDEGNGKAKINFKPLADYAKFTYSGRKIRVTLSDELAAQKKFYNTKELEADYSKIPRYVRVGRSIIYTMIEKLKDLELLERLVPATKLAKLTQGTVVGVQVPQQYDVSKALEAAQQVQDTLNSSTGIDSSTGEITLQDVMESTGMFKVVPIFGDKGRLEKLDYKSEEPDDLLSAIDDIRSTIASSIGVPPEILFGGDGPKSEILKRYARYVRKLKNIQKAVKNGLLEIIYVHLTNKNIPYKKEDIQVEFLNKLVNVDALDSLEYTDSLIGMIANIKDFVTDLAEEDSPLAEYISMDKFAALLKDQLQMAGLSSIVTLPGDTEEPDAEDDDDIEDEEGETTEGGVNG